MKFERDEKSCNIMRSPLAEGRGLKFWIVCHGDHPPIVAPRRGAWIEIQLIRTALVASQGRPSQRGVD